MRKGRPLKSLAIRPISSGARAFMAALTLAAGVFSAGEAAAQDPDELFHIAKIRPVIAEGAETRWFDGGPAEGRIGAFVGEAAAKGAAKAMTGARPLALEIRVRRFVPVKAGEARVFGPDHEIRADYVLIDEASGDVLNVSEQDLDLWAQTRGGILGGSKAQERIANHIAVMTEIWGRQLSCRRMKCPTAGPVAPRPTSPEIVGVVYQEGAGTAEANPSPRARPTLDGPEPRAVTALSAPLGPRVVEQPIAMPAPLPAAPRGTADAPAPGRSATPLEPDEAVAAAPAEEAQPSIVILAPEKAEPAAKEETAAVVVAPAEPAAEPEPVVTLTLESETPAAPAEDDDFFATSFDDSAATATPPPVAAEPVTRPKPKVSAVFDLSGALAADD